MIYYYENNTLVILLALNMYETVYVPYFKLKGRVIDKSLIYSLNCKIITQSVYLSNFVRVRYVFTNDYKLVDKPLPCTKIFAIKNSKVKSIQLTKI